MKGLGSFSLALLLVAGVTVAATPDDVGDADSFGHVVVYLGFKQTIPVNLSSDCTGSDPARGRCVPLVEGGTTVYDEKDLAVIRLPARATRTLLCHALTEFVSRDNFNFEGAPKQLQFTGVAQLTIENSVLNDPSLINKLTGQPFNGSFTTSSTLFSENRPIADQAQEHFFFSATKLCGPGIVSRQQLIQVYGLSPTQATLFFQRPITIRMGAAGRSQMSAGVQFLYSLRLFGDQ
jgi:hypothetical protein